MLAEIKRMYGTLGDAVVEKFEYATSSEDGYTKALQVHLRCINWETEKWQKVTLMCDNVTHFQFLDNSKTQSSVVFEALLQQDANGIVVDFYPIQVDGLGILAEDPQSSFVLHCQAIRYVVQG